MSLYTWGVLGALCVAILAFATGSVLVLGYAVAGAAFFVITALMIRRLVRHRINLGSIRPRMRSVAYSGDPHESDRRRAA